jgi:UDP-galactopyranose mutase
VIKHRNRIRNNMSNISDISKSNISKTNISKTNISKTNMPKVIITIFAGRHEYVSILKKYLDQLLDSELVYQVHLWNYTRNDVDNDYIRSLAENDEKYILFDRDFIRKNEKKVWDAYYGYYTKTPFSDETIIIKCDDDIVYIDVNNFSRYISEIKGDHLYYPNIVNNDVCAHIQSINKVHNFLPNVDRRRQALGNAQPLTGWFTDKQAAVKSHEHFLTNHEQYAIEIPLIKYGSRISINFFGAKIRTIQKYYKMQLRQNRMDDEGFLSGLACKLTGVSNVIVPFFVVVHFSFGPQLTHELKEIYIPRYNKMATNTLKKYDLVIARYNEPLDWLQKINISKINRIFIYNKNSEPIRFTENLSFNKKIIIKNIPNVGRESHTYLNHLITHYDDLSDRIIFTQAKFSDHLYGNRSISTKFNDFFADTRSFFVAYPYDEGIKKLRIFFWIQNTRLNKDGYCFEDWAKAFVEPHLDKIINSTIMIKYGACFTINREDCRSRPLHFYQQLINTINDHNNPEEGHFFERIWYYIFNLHKEKIRKNPDHVVIGAGLSGAVVAEQLASLGNKVLVIEKRNHLGGNCYDEICNETKIRVSKYGAHIFHTNNNDVWNYVNKFGEWCDYHHRVYGKVNSKVDDKVNDKVDGGINDKTDEYFPIPINIKTVNILCNQNIKTEDEMKQYIDSVRDKTIINPKNSEEYCLSRFGRQLYESVVRDYTYKQWGKYPDQLDVSVLQRIPLRYDFSEGYFNDKYQALPKEGYTTIISNILSNPNILVSYGEDFNSMSNRPCATFMTWYTGPIDAYFKNSNLPKLEYRSINFENKIIHHTEFYQPYPVINYTQNNVDYTRIVEYKHFLNQTSPHTNISFERTTDKGDPYYPIPDKRNYDLYEEYKKLASDTNKTIFLGRLASYKYYNMDQAILNSLDRVTEYVRSLNDNKKVININTNESSEDVKNIKDTNQGQFITKKYTYLKTGTKIIKKSKKKISFCATRDVHIGLACKAKTNDLFVEIVLGGWNNTKSCIRHQKQGSPVTTTEYRPCDPNKYVDVFIEVNNFGVVVYDSNNNQVMKSNIYFENNPEIEVASWNTECKWII